MAQTLQSHCVGILSTYVFYILSDKTLQVQALNCTREHVLRPAEVLMPGH